MAHEPNPVKLVSWFMASKGVIKFANDETTYKLADAVVKASNFEKFPLAKGDKVEVGIKEGIVTFLRKQKSDAPKAEGHGSEEAYEPTPEEEKGTVEPEKPKAPAPAEANPPIVDGGVRELTVFAVAANKKVVKFLECKDAGWFQIAEAIQAQDYKVIGLEAKKKANVLITENTVMSFQKVASEPAEQPKTTTYVDVQSERIATPSTTFAPAPAQAAKKEWKPASSYDTAEKQTSIEAQASVNAANEVAGQVAAAITVTSRKEDGTIAPPTANVINNIIRAIAESNFALIQELKKK